jgi:hypothetical protein
MVEKKKEKERKEEEEAYSPVRWQRNDKVNRTKITAIQKDVT